MKRILSGPGPWKFRRVVDSVNIPDLARIVHRVNEFSFRGHDALSLTICGFEAKIRDDGRWEITTTIRKADSIRVVVASNPRGLDLGMTWEDYTAKVYGVTDFCKVAFGRRVRAAA